jgi:hypothetical protein
LGVLPLADGDTVELNVESNTRSVGATDGIDSLNICKSGIIPGNALVPGCCDVERPDLAVAMPIFLLYNISTFWASVMEDIYIYYLIIINSEIIHIYM